MKKKILIAVLAVIVIALAAVGYFVIADKRQEDKLRTELSEISELTNSQTPDIDAIREKLDRTVTTGDYAVVEGAFKAYLRESFDNIIEIADILNDEKITSLLTLDNYQEDGKDFVESKNYIAETRKALEECKTKYTEAFTEEEVMSYINDKGLDDYYIDLYKREFVGDISSSDDNTLETSIDEVIEILNISENILNMLSENQDSWEINGENIVFETQDLTDEYNALIDSLYQYLRDADNA